MPRRCKSLFSTFETISRVCCAVGVCFAKFRRSVAIVACAQTLHLNYGECGTHVDFWIEMDQITASSFQRNEPHFQWHSHITNTIRLLRQLSLWSHRRSSVQNALLSIELNKKTRSFFSSKKNQLANTKRKKAARQKIDCFAINS